jgi:hypothetical protein
MRQLSAFFKAHLWPAAGIAVAAICWTYGLVSGAGEIAALVLSPMQWQLIAGGIFGVSVVSILVQWHSAKTASPTIDPTKAPTPAPAHAITSHNQSGGITAHTVNQAPKPEIKWGALTVAVHSDGKNMISGRFEVVAPYPPAALHLRAISPGIETFQLSPVGRTGVFLEGHSGKRDGWCFTTLHHPIGTYQATVVTASDQLKFKHNFE